MSVIQTIEEQVSFGFTGRVNVLKESDGQFMGVILLRDGLIVGAQFARKTGIKAIVSLLIVDLDSIVDIKLVVEPEVIADNDIDFTLKIEDLKANIKTIYEEHNEAKKLRPSDSLRILISPNYIESGEKPNFNEFSVLKTMVEFSKIEEIYKNTDLFDFEITNSLVNLRKKGAIKVVK